MDPLHPLGAGGGVSPEHLPAPLGRCHAPEPGSRVESRILLGDCLWRAITAVNIMDARATLRTDIGYFVGTLLCALLKPLHRVYGVQIQVAQNNGLDFPGKVHVGVRQQVLLAS